MKIPKNKKKLQWSKFPDLETRNPNIGEKKVFNESENRKRKNYEIKHVISQAEERKKDENHSKSIDMSKNNK